MKNTAFLVIYKGRVQGVGFRFTVLRFAQGYDSIVGYVKNLPDGAVELYVEGKITK
jgi:acylphosphatase